MTTYINLYGGPGTGKSTTAAGLFYNMKHRNFKCELVTEFAKDLAYEGREDVDQLTIFARQFERMQRLQEKVAYVITDAPLELSLVYAQGTERDTPAFRDLIREATSLLGSSAHVFLKRVKPYKQYGRFQTEDEARALDVRIKSLLESEPLPHWVIEANDVAPAAIMEKLGLNPPSPSAA